MLKKILTLQTLVDNRCFFDGYMIPGKLVEGDYTYIGYSEGKFGKLHGNFAELVTLYTSSGTVDGELRNVLYISMFRDKVSKDGGVAHVLSVDIKSSVYSDNLYLIPDAGTEAIDANNGIWKVSYPNENSSYHIAVTDIPDEFVLTDKEGNVIDSMPLSFPQKPITKEMTGWLPSYRKKGKLVSGNTYSLRQFVENEKTNVSIDVTQITGGGI